MRQVRCLGCWIFVLPTIGLAVVLNPTSAVAFMPAMASTSARGGYIVNLSDFYSYRLIGKLTAFMQLQEFSQCNLPVEDSFSFAARLSLLG